MAAITTEVEAEEDMVVAEAEEDTGTEVAVVDTAVIEVGAVTTVETKVDGVETGITGVDTRDMVVEIVVAVDTVVVTEADGNCLKWNFSN